MKGTEDEKIEDESPWEAGGAHMGNPEFVQVVEMVKKQSEEVYDRRGWAVWDDDKICLAPLSDSQGSDGRDITYREWRLFYDIGLCGRLALYCYNFHKGTNYEFEFVSKLYTPKCLGTKMFITLEAWNPANESPFTLTTWVNHDDMQLSWETCFCDVEDSEEADLEWDTEAIDDLYKGEMPKWVSDDDLQHCYVVEDSELKDTKNWWLHLFAEFGFYAKWYGPCIPEDIAECLPLKTQKVVVETRGVAETEPREKLKAANVIFYISFQCGDDPMTREVVNYRAVVRKTMDGKPGHVRLEVSCWSI